MCVVYWCWGWGTWGECCGVEGEGEKERKEGQKHTMLIHSHEGETLRDVKKMENARGFFFFFFWVVGSACRDRRI